MSTRKWVLGLAASAAIVLMAWAPAWACVSGPVVHLSTTNARPGDQITVTGSGFNTTGPIAVHWNALAGPVLATTHVPDGSGAMGTFTVPADAQTGIYVVIFTPTSTDGQLRVVPIRAVLSVSANGVAAPAALSTAPSVRADGLVTDRASVPAGALVLTAVGVAGGVVLLAGLGVFVAGRRRSGQPETVNSVP